MYRSKCFLGWFEPLERECLFPGPCALDLPEEEEDPLRLPCPTFSLFGADCLLCVIGCVPPGGCNWIVMSLPAGIPVRSTAAPCCRGLALAADAFPGPCAVKSGSTHQAFPGFGLPVVPGLRLPAAGCSLMHFGIRQIHVASISLQVRVVC